MPHVRAPITIFHGSEDDMVPVSHGRALAEAAASGNFIEVRGAVHNEIPVLQLRKELDELLAALSVEDEQD